MGTYTSLYWQSAGWGMNRRERQSGTYRAYLPDLLTSLDLSLAPQTACAVSRAESAIRLLNMQTRVLTDTEPLARLLLRSEALASSRIEGLEMNAGRLLEHEALDELGIPHRLDGAEALVLANIDALQEGIAQAAVRPSLDLATICDINRTLLAHTDLHEWGGRIRDTQNWIGGNNVNPIGAAFVPPQPQHVPKLLDDLIRFCNESPLPPLAKAAVAHAQLETIHPFADGNGRTGRALVHVILKQAGIVPSVVPPISLILATNRARYVSNLMAFRTNRDDPASPSPEDAANDWIEYFANATLIACERSEDFEARIYHIQQDWLARLKVRRGSAAQLLVTVLPTNPVVSIASAARLIGRSNEAARLAVRRLQEEGILIQNARNRKSGLYAAPDILNAFTTFERALATVSGDTAMEKPGRHVPQRAALPTGKGA